jgi:hypothetical protein
MTQPKCAPIGLEDEVRPAYKLDVPRPWTPHRPGEFDHSARSGEFRTGPDQGYAELLAGRVVDRIRLGDGEHVDDALAAVVAIGMARAASFGRAPVIRDLEFAIDVLGYAVDQPAELVVRRCALVGGVAHDRWHRRELVALLDDAALRGAAEPAATALLATACPA